MQSRHERDEGSRNLTPKLSVEVSTPLPRLWFLPVLPGRELAAAGGGENLGECEGPRRCVPQP